MLASSPLYNSGVVLAEDPLVVSLVLVVDLTLIVR